MSRRLVEEIRVFMSNSYFFFFNENLRDFSIYFRIIRFNFDLNHLSISILVIECKDNFVGL